MAIPIIIVAGVMVFLLLVIIVAGGVLVNVGGQQVGIVERRFFGRTLPEGRVVAMRREVGVQARVLPPGLHFMFPFIYGVTKTGLLVISENEVGLIESIDGLSLDPGRIFARRVGGHDTYQDGEAFLTNGGQKGPQIDILPPGQYRINTYLFTIRNLPSIFIAQNQVGVVNARDGDPITPGRLPRPQGRWSPGVPGRRSVHPARGSVRPAD